MLKGEKLFVAQSGIQLSGSVATGNSWYSATSEILLKPDLKSTLQPLSLLAN